MKKLICLAVALLSICCRTAVAQTETATISGRITDPQGAVIAEADVLATNIDTNVTVSTKTNSSGIYVIPNLPPGNYRLTVKNPGFKEIVKTGLVLHVQDTIAQNFAMEIGSAQETITVTGGAPLINTESAAVSTIVDRQFVENMPLNGRTLQSLLTLSPGVVLVNAATSSDGGQISINGQRPTANYFNLDGVSANIGVNYQNAGGTIPGTSALGSTNSLVSVEALQEFRIQTSSYAPEYGRSPGGQVTLATRSGTNEYHGTAFEYLRNDIFDARDWFVNQSGAKKPPLRLNNFGSVLGGPIFRNKTFFFLSYEGQRLVQPKFAITSVPSLASRQASLPASQPILNAYPVPNGPDLGGGLAQVSSGYSNRGTLDAGSFRLDHNFNDKIRTFARYSYSPSETADRTQSGAFALSTTVQIHFDVQTLTAGLTNIISRALVNDLRANVSNTSAAQAYATDAFGGAKPIPDSMLFPAPRSAGDTAVTFSLGFTGSVLRTGIFTVTEERQINLVDGLSYSFGNHQIKIGADYRRELPFYNGFNGISYTYPNITGAISNRPSSTAASLQSRVSAGLTNFSAYAQDSWKGSKRLSLTYGLRWEVNTAPHTLGGTNNFLPLVGDITNPSSLTVGTLGGELWPTKYANVGLRFGLAYQLRQTPGRELVLRAGAGVFYDTGTGFSALGSFFGAYPNQVSKILPAGTGFPLTPDQAAIPSPSLTAPVAGSRFFMYPSDLQLPRTYQWNTALERSLDSAQTISASYVGAIGRKLLRGDQYGNVTSQRYVVQYTSNAGTSDYHSFQLQYQRRLSHGLAALASYTWSHSIDTASTDESFTVPATIIPARVDRGPSDFDIRHVLNAAVSYDIPALKGHAWISRILDHWGVDSIVTARSATPVTPTSFRDIGFGALFFRPDVVPGVPLYLTDPTVGGGRRFNPLAFTIPATAQGNLGRNALRGFPLSQVDLSIRRMFPLTEKLRLQFRGDLFNVLNHPNFGNPVNNLTNPLFGRSTTMANATLGAGGLFGGLNPTFQMGGPRSMQFSLKLSF